jgi:hypothetical protein
MLVSMTPAGQSAVTFDTGRTGISTFDFDATTAIGMLPGQFDVYDLMGDPGASAATPIQPVELEVSWNILVSCGSGGSPGVSHVQDVLDSVMTALATQQVCTLVAYKLGYTGATVQNSKCRLVRVTNEDDIVSHWRGKLTFRTQGTWGP